MRSDHGFRRMNTVALYGEEMPVRRLNPSSPATPSMAGYSCDIASIFE